MGAALRSATFACALVFSAVCAEPAVAKPEGIQITPVIVEIAPERGMTSLRLRNWSNEEVSLDSALFDWSQPYGEDVLTPSKDIMISPSVFSIAPGKEQIVRLALRQKPDAVGKERSYRLFLRELPSSQAQVNGLRVQIQMSLPVFVTTKDGAPSLRITESAKGDVVLANSGSSRARLLSAQKPDGAVVEGLPLYLLSGATTTMPDSSGLHALSVKFLSRQSATPVLQTLTADDAGAVAGGR